MMLYTKGIFLPFADTYIIIWLLSPFKRIADEHNPGDPVIPYREHQVPLRVIFLNIWIPGAEDQQN
jgi:hypothetical protein